VTSLPSGRKSGWGFPAPHPTFPLDPSGNLPVEKCVRLLLENPKHPGLRTHEFFSIEHPYEKGAKVFEAYVQNRTPGAYRLFWCYGPDKGEITIIAITAHR